MAFFTHSLIGLDIAPRALKLVALRKKKFGWIVEQMAFKTFTEEIFADCKIQNFRALQDLLTEFVEELDLRGAVTSLHIPAHLVRMQCMTVAKELRNSDIEAEIYAHVQKDLPGIQEALSIDYTVIKEDEMTVDILFAAARQMYLSQYVMCVKGAHLNPKIVDVDIYALRRALAFSLDLKNMITPQLILYMTDEIATLIAFRRDALIFYQHWEVNNSPNVFLLELKNHLQMCLSTIPKIDRLTICAEKPLSAIVKEFLAESFILDDPNPFQYGKISFVKSIDEAWAIKHAQTFLLALGLAMREAPKW